MKYDYDYHTKVTLVCECLLHQNLLQNVFFFIDYMWNNQNEHHADLKVGCNQFVVILEKSDWAVVVAGTKDAAADGDVAAAAAAAFGSIQVLQNNHKAIHLKCDAHGAEKKFQFDCEWLFG